MCSLIMVENASDDGKEKQYFDLPFRGGLTVPSSQMAEFVWACFVIFDYTDKFIARRNESTIRESVERLIL